MNVQGKTVCFLGDSITEGFGASATEKCFVSLFAAAHPATRVHNYGIGGTRIADQKVPMELKYEFPFYTRVEQMADKADLICVFGGTNDFGHGDAPMGTWGDKTPETFYGALYTLSEKLLQRYSNAKIVFFTPLHRSGETTPTKRADGMWTLADYVETVRKNAEYFSFPVLDLWKVSGMLPVTAEERQKFMPDGLHPNDAGYEKLFAIVNSFIETL